MKTENFTLRIPRIEGEIIENKPRGLLHTECSARSVPSGYTNVLTSRISFFLVMSSCLVLIFSSSGFAQGEKLPIVVDGDYVEFFNDEKKIVARGNVNIEYKETRLLADKVVVYSLTNDIIAEGNVRLDYEKGTLEGEKILYNFKTKMGTIIDADIESAPFYGKSPLIKKLSDRELVLRRGYFTTCDLDSPHWRIVAKRIYIFPGDKIVAKQASFFIGNWPLITIPQYVKVLNDRRPRVTVIPGRDKEWGYYLLTAWRYYFNEGARGRLHLDYRERKDFAHGIDFHYEPKGMGEGLLRTYYMHERAIQTSHLYKLPRDTKEKERFRIQWRHKWQIDPSNAILWEYNRSKDKEFLKDYFEREHKIDPSLDTYMQFTHAQNLYAINLLLEKRVNRFTSRLEKLPEVSLETVNFRVGKTRFYFKTDNKFSNFRQQNAGQTDFDDIISRFDTYNKFTYSTRLFFLSMSPFVGMRNTYYSQDLDKNKHVLRGIFQGGLDISTRFYRIFDVKGKFLGVDYNLLRHIINPTIEYAYIHQPSISSSRLHNFDSIDSMSKANSASLSLINKLQTKRAGSSIDLISHTLSSGFTFKDSGSGGHFSDILDSELEIRPKDWFRLDMDTSWDRIKGEVLSNEFDLYFDGERDEVHEFSLGLGHRYQRDEDNQFIFDISYRVNPKWKFRAYQRFDFTGGILREQQYTILRDLHCWDMEVTYHVDRERGESIWFSFKVKAFPELGFEFDTTYHQPKAGSQSY